MVFTLADQYWIGLMIFKNFFKIWTGSDSILSDQYWTRTEKITQSARLCCLVVLWCILWIKFPQLA